MKKIITISILVLVLFCGCDDASELEIRLSNVSQYDFQNIKVATSTNNVDFEDINAEQNTGYKVFESVYRYAFIELEIDANDSQNQYDKLTLTLIG